MINYNLILELLKIKWHNEKKLPATFYGIKYTGITIPEYTSIGKIYYYRIEEVKDIMMNGMAQQTFSYTLLGPEIKLKKAINEIWHLLPKNEQDKIMIGVLGGNV